MNYFRITIGLLGIILTIVGVIMVILFSNIKKKGFKNFYTYFQENTVGSRKAKIAGCVLMGGCFLILIAAKIKD